MALVGKKVDKFLGIIRAATFDDEGVVFGL